MLSVKPSVLFIATSSFQIVSLNFEMQIGINYIKNYFHGFDIQNSDCMQMDS